MQFGSLKLETNLFLSPLAGYTNLPFRLVLREVGGLGLTTTDLVNARSLLERNPKALKLIESNEMDSPYAVQLFGAVPEEMRDASQYLESIGVDAIDINMGCPVRKVCKTGGGSAMMTELDKTANLVEMMVNAVNIPITAKMRLGWDDNNITAPNLVRVLEDVGVKAIFIHGRTREQGFLGTVNLAGIREVVAAAREIPVIGNGDITTPESAKHMIEATGCHGISAGRGAFYNPWLFKHTDHYLKTGELLPDPKFLERVRVMRRHFDLMIEVFGEERGCLMFRKVAPWYAKRFGPVKMFNKRVVQISTREDFELTLSDYLDWRDQFVDSDGELIERYRQGPMVPTFMQDGELPEAGKNEIPVPKGPVEVW